MADDGTSLRFALRAATRDVHDRLDAAMATWPLEPRRSYARFLALQYAAREPLERGLAARAPAGLLPPPPVTALIAADLAELGEPCPAAATAIVPEDGDAALGMAWVLAGSSLGNRFIARQRRGAGLDEAMLFLTDNRLSAYFKDLLPALARPASTARRDGAVAGAAIAFASFTRELESLGNPAE